jgi:hypothetical protein
MLLIFGMLNKYNELNMNFLIYYIITGLNARMTIDTESATDSTN